MTKNIDEKIINLTPQLGDVINKLASLGDDPLLVATKNYVDKIEEAYSNSGVNQAGGILIIVRSDNQSDAEWEVVRRLISGGVSNKNPYEVNLDGSDGNYEVDKDESLKSYVKVVPVIMYLTQDEYSKNIGKIKTLGSQDPDEKKEGKKKEEEIVVNVNEGLRLIIGGERLSDEKPVIIQNGGNIPLTTEFANALNAAAQKLEADGKTKTPSGMPNQSALGSYIEYEEGYIKMLQYATKVCMCEPGREKIGKSR